MSLEEKEQCELISDACRRNSQVEIHRQRVAGDLITLRGRFVSETEDLIEFELPRIDPESDTLNPGNIVTAYIVHGSDVYSFMAEIQGINKEIHLNEFVETQGIWVRRLSDVTPSQRRNAFRIPLAGSYDIEVDIHPATRDANGASPVDGKLFHGELVEGSSTGLGIVVDGNATRQIPDRSFAFAKFKPLDDEPPFVFRVEIRHHRLVLNRSRTRFGLRLVEWPNRAYYAREINRFERFTTEVERERRRRLAG